MGVKIKLASEFDPRGFDAADRRLAAVRDKAVAHSNTIQGAFMRTGGSIVGFGDTLTNVGGAVSGAGDSMTRNLTLPLLGIAGAAFTVAGDFEQSMNLVQAATDAPAKDMAKLDELAKKMGADTVFSANEAAGAMLELAKSGMTPAQIQAGALDSALQLAAAGQIGLESAATTTANAINMFGLKAEDAAAVADALAGGANASSASVESLQQALSQVGPGARNAGLDLQDTVGVLAMFADRGIQGSDAGTSLKTMLTRLIPTTTAAADAMDAYGLSFVDSKGNIDDITVVAEKLQNKLGNLSEEERNRALTMLFGSDATRAATVLMQQGAEGTQKYIKATQDREAAERMSDAAMKGSKGSIEQMMGSLETAALTIGQGVAPSIISLAGEVKGLADKFSALSPEQQKTIVKYGLIVAAAGPVLSITGRLISVVGGLTKGIGYSITGMGRFIGGLRGVEGASNTVAGGVGNLVRNMALGIKSTALWVIEQGKLAAAMAGNFIKNLASTVVELGKSAIAWTVDTAKKAASTVATVAHTTASIAANVATKAWAAGQWLLNAALTANPIGLVVAGIALLVAGFIYAWKHSEKFRDVVTGAWTAIKTATVSVFNGIVDFFRRWGPTMLIVLGGPVVWIVALIVKNWDTIKSKTVEFGNAFRTTVSNAVNAVVGFFRGLPGRITGAFAGAKNLLVNVGNDIVTGLHSGISKAWDWLVGKLKGLVDLLPGAVKKVLGIASPSKVFMGLGGHIVDGLALGMTGGVGTIVGAANQLAAATMFTPSPSFAGATPSGGGYGSVNIAPGAITIVLPEGTPEATQRAAGQGVLEALARELNRR